MLKTYIAADSLITPLGNSSEENFVAATQLKYGVCLQENSKIQEDPFWASLFSTKQWDHIASLCEQPEQYTRFEQLLIAAIIKASGNVNVDLKSEETLFVFSTTKGNIALLEQEPASDCLREKLQLYYSAKIVAAYFQNPVRPHVISNACISGSAAVLYAKRILEKGQYKHVVVAGADTISRFVFSGFKSFQALSAGMCKPFSVERDGINLGEAGAAVILTTNPLLITDKPFIQVSGGAVCNDANHISGPSKTGQELSRAIDRALQAADVPSEEVDFISAHGTATLFNDEMEAKAFALSHLSDVPVNSLKGYFGHTLGAAGLVESIMSVHSLWKNKILPTPGFTKPGVSVPITVNDHLLNKQIRHCLKTASGFGGCNAALVYSKLE